MYTFIIHTIKYMRVEVCYIWYAIQVLADTCMEIEDFNFEAGREKENKTKNQNPDILPRKSMKHKISCDRYEAQH